MEKVHLRNMQSYVPLVMSHGDGSYLKDEKGRDWYEWREYFSQDTMKVLYDGSDKHLVVTLTKEHYFINPHELSICEIDESEVPANYSSDGSWSFIDGKLCQLPGVKAEIVRLIRNTLLNASDILMQPFYTYDDEPLPEALLKMIHETRMSLKRLPKQEGFPDTSIQIPEVFIQMADRHGFQVEWLERTAAFCPFIIVK